MHGVRWRRDFEEDGTFTKRQHRVMVRWFLDTDLDSPAVTLLLASVVLSRRMGTPSCPLPWFSAPDVSIQLQVGLTDDREEPPGAGDSLEAAFALVVELDA